MRRLNFPLDLLQILDEWVSVLVFGSTKVLLWKREEKNTQKSRSYSGRTCSMLFRTVDSFSMNSCTSIKVLYRVWYCLVVRFNVATGSCFVFKVSKCNLLWLYNSMNLCWYWAISFPEGVESSCLWHSISFLVTSPVDCLSCRRAASLCSHSRIRSSSAAIFISKEAFLVRNKEIHRPARPNWSSQSCPPSVGSCRASHASSSSHPHEPIPSPRRDDGFLPTRWI